MRWTSKYDEDYCYSFCAFDASTRGLVTGRGEFWVCVLSVPREYSYVGAANTCSLFHKSEIAAQLCVENLADAFYSKLYAEKV